MLLPLPVPSVATQICFQALRKPVGSALQSIFAQVLSFQTGQVSSAMVQDSMAVLGRPAPMIFLFISRLEEEHGEIHGTTVGSAAFT